LTLVNWEIGQLVDYLMKGADTPVSHEKHRFAFDLKRLMSFLIRILGQSGIF
jgi:hypothetical protein